MALRIEDNVDGTLENVNQAQAQLLKYLNTISSNRWLILKVRARTYGCKLSIDMGTSVKTHGNFIINLQFLLCALGLRAKITAMVSFFRRQGYKAEHENAVHGE